MSEGIFTSSTKNAISRACSAWVLTGATCQNGVIHFYAIGDKAVQSFILKDPNVVLYIQLLSGTFSLTVNLKDGAGNNLINVSVSGATAFYVATMTDANFYANAGTQVTLTLTLGGGTGQIEVSKVFNGCKCQFGET